MKLIAKEFKVYRIEETVFIGEKSFQEGTFLIPNQKGLLKELSEIGKNLHLIFFPIAEELLIKTQEIKPPKVGVYQRYWEGNIDEGWTRWILEQFEVPYTTIMDKNITDGILEEICNVLIIPSDRKSMIKGEFEENLPQRGRDIPHHPPEYRSGINHKGLENLKKFVDSGGTLVALNNSCDYIIEEFKLPIRNVLSDLDTKTFFCPGSTLKVHIDNSSSAAYGMPSEGFIVFMRMLQSGWLIGEKNLSHQAAMIEAKQGKGKIVLIGFRPQLRAQTHGTFKFLFNLIVN
jgi:hypothetical protein